MKETVTISNKTGRRVSDKQQGTVTHARMNGNYKALCGTEPGKRSSWTEYPTVLDYPIARMKAEKLVTCKRCKTALYKWGDKPRSYNCHLR